MMVYNVSNILNGGNVMGILIRDISEPGRFFQAVNSCSGKVELLTSEGDRLNLKSKLCQYIALTQMFEEKRVERIELELSEPGELEKIKKYLVLD